MSYKCDICSTVMPSKEAGTYFDQNRVSTSPGYWEYLIHSVSGSMDMERIGMYVQMCTFMKGGFVVCNKCREMINNDSVNFRDFGLEKYIRSIPSGDVDVSAIKVVSETIFKKSKGILPSTSQPSKAVPKKQQPAVKLSTAVPKKQQPTTKPSTAVLKNQQPTAKHSAETQKKQQSATQHQPTVSKKWWQFWK